MSLPNSPGGGMATAKLSEMVTRLGRRPGPPDPAAPDPDLLAHFLADRDEQAFALLVRRHGPMVFGVCRRVTGDHHLAEDAFQAVFVVLAARAGSVRPRAALPAWLYGVAYRTALRARTMADRRRKHERVAGETRPAVQADEHPADRADVVAALDAEIARLPEHLRVPVVLCELEGRSRAEAAGRLGIPEGTLSSRLAAARKALAARLRRRGVALSAAGLTAALTRVAGAAPVPADLAARAVTAAVTPGVVPAPVAALSHGVLRAMFAQKLKAVPVAVALAAAVALAGGLLLAADPKPDPAPVRTPGSPVAVVVDAPKPAPAAKPRPKRSSQLLFYRAGRLSLIDPDGRNEKRVSRDRGENHPGYARLSPDGKTLAVLVPGPLPPDDGTNNAKKRTMLLHVRGLGEPEPGTPLGVECQLFVWSADGTEIACTDFVDGPNKATPEATTLIVNVKTKEKTTLRLPDDHVITDWSRDGKLFLTTRARNGKPAERSARLYLMNRDGTEHKALTPPAEQAIFGKLAPAGDRVLYVSLKADATGDPVQTLTVLDVAAGKATPVADTPLNGMVIAYCWAPDGKKIAYTWREVHAGKPEEVQDRETESFLVVCDPDGRNAKTVATEKGQNPWVITIGHVDWGFVADPPDGPGRDR